MNIKQKKAAARLYDHISKAANKAGYTTQRGYLSADGMVVKLEASVPEAKQGKRALDLCATCTSATQAKGES